MIDSPYFLFAAPFAALALVAALIPLARRLAIARDFVDRPGGRKQHEEPVPPIGGLVIFPVFALMILIGGGDIVQFWPYFSALALLLGIGYIDDRRQVPAKLKFLIHFTAAFLVVIPGGAVLHDLGDLFGNGPFELGWFAIPFSVACVVYMINAINMMDGIDGLGGGIGLVILGWMMIACAGAGDVYGLALTGTLAGALGGFLLYNMRHPWRSRACIFLGDAGSMALGLTIAWLAIGLVQQPDPALVPISVAWILAVPIVDAFGLFAMRIYERRHPFDADRRHLHHHFIHAGFTPAQTTAWILGWAILLGGFGYGAVLVGVPQAILTWTWIALWIGHAVMTMKPDGLISLLSRNRGQSSVSGPRE